MFHVVYLFDVMDGRQADFERAWKELTEAIYRNSGSLMAQPKNMGRIARSPARLDWRHSRPHAGLLPFR